MAAYIFRRLLLIFPTLFGIMLLNFVVVQFAPGGPVEQTIAALQGHEVGATNRFASAGGEAAAGGSSRADQGIDPELLADITAYYGFDKPAHERFWDMMTRYAAGDFGESFFRSSSVLDLIIERLPVSLSLGLWSLLIIYSVAIPLGIKKAMQDGSRFDMVSSLLMVVGYAVPSFLFAILLIILFAGGEYWQWFPLRGLVSDGWEDMSWLDKMKDYIWHMTLPIMAMVVSGFASLAMLTKHSFLEEMSRMYVSLARAKGLSERQVLWGHVFRNAMLIVIAGFPAAFIGALFTSSMLIEVVFSLDGLGLLGFEAVLQRDYPVMFGTLFIFTLLGLVVNILGDLAYVLVDPRIDFESRE